MCLPYALPSDYMKPVQEDIQNLYKVSYEKYNPLTDPDQITELHLQKL